MGRLGMGFDPDIGSRTAKGWSRFIGIRRRARDLSVLGGGAMLDPGPQWDFARPAGRRTTAPSTGVPQDLLRGERFSEITDA